jgi:hypothetical protein
LLRGLGRRRPGNGRGDRDSGLVRLKQDTTYIESNSWSG